MLVEGNPQGIRYFTCWSEHMKHSDKLLSYCIFNMWMYLPYICHILHTLYRSGTYSIFWYDMKDFCFYISCVMLHFNRKQQLESAKIRCLLLLFRIMLHFITEIGDHRKYKIVVKCSVACKLRKTVCSLCFVLLSKISSKRKQKLDIFA